MPMRRMPVPMLRLSLTDQQMVLDADGKSRPAARFVPLVVPAIRDGMDVPAPMVITVLAAHAGEGSNDPYGNTVWAKVRSPTLLNH